MAREAGKGLLAGVDISPSKHRRAAVDLSQIVLPVRFLNRIPLTGLVAVVLGLPLGSLLPLGSPLALAQPQSQSQSQSQSQPAGQPQVGANMKDQMILGFCSRAMAADLDKAGKKPPAGMVDYTCGCVVQQINARASIDQAKTICQAQAQQKYALQ
jgi:hypothetical protein